jgi:hypothetical protein
MSSFPALFSPRAPLAALFLSFTLAVSAPTAHAAERQVGPSNVSSSFGFYGTTPENPAGRLVAYVAYKPGITPDSTRQEGELWVVDTDFANPRKVADITGFSPHDGAELSWLDDHRVAFRDYQRELRTSALRVVDVRTGKDTIPPHIGATTLGHNPHGSRILFNATDKDGRHAGLEPGIHEWDTETGAVRPVFLTKEQVASVLPQLPPKAVVEGLLPPSDWQCLHSQYSPDGRKVLFRLDVAKPTDAWLVAVCDVDGKNLVLMQSEAEHMLHVLWRDSDTLVAHDREGAHWTKPGVLKLWKIGAGSGVPIGIPGNHLAVSPDGKHFASETGYHSNPVVLRYFPEGTLDLKDAKIITEHRFPEITWKKSFHINPSFSRDGKRIYYHKPLNNEINGTFCFDLSTP